MNDHLLPRDWEPLRQEAERLAQEANATIPGPVTVCWWTDDKTAEEDRLDAVLTGVFIGLLRDLSRPASRDHWIRWGIEHDERWKVAKAAGDCRWWLVQGPCFHASGDSTCHASTESREEAEYLLTTTRREWWIQIMLHDDPDRLRAELAILREEQDHDDE